MNEVITQVLSGSLASIVGGVIGFSSANAIRKRQREEYLLDRKRASLFDAFSKLHSVYVKLLGKPISEREISEADFQNIDYVVTFLVVHYPELLDSHGTKLSNVATNIFLKKYYTREQKEELFLLLDGPVVDLLNEFQDILVGYEQ
jgi:hypothetical protein